MLYLLFLGPSMNSSENRSSRGFAFWANQSNLESGGAQLPSSVLFPFMPWAQSLRATVASDISQISTSLPIHHRSPPLSSPARLTCRCRRSPHYSLLPNPTTCSQ